MSQFRRGFGLVKNFSLHQQLPLSVHLRVNTVTKYYQCRTFIQFSQAKALSSNQNIQKRNSSNFKMAQYKFTYFDARGVAEPIRQILTYSGTPFEDVRIPLDGLTPKKKEELELEWGQLPILEIDGVKRAQSYAISRYLSRKFNIAGKDEFEQFRCDEIAEAVRDYFQKSYPLFGYLFGEDPAVLEEQKKIFQDVDSPMFLKRFENILERQGKTWLVGDSLTYADIYLAHFTTHLQNIFNLKLIGNFPAVSKLIDAVENHPKLKKYFDERPKAIKAVKMT